MGKRVTYRYPPFCRCENGGKEANSRTAIDVSDLDSGGPIDGCVLEAVWLGAKSVKKHRVAEDRHAQVEMSVALRLVGVVNSEAGEQKTSGGKGR